MPRIILKCPYLKGGSSSGTAHLENLVGYIATRDGVEFVSSKNSNAPSTVKQSLLITQMLSDLPDLQNLFEYQDYQERPNMENASEFISRAVEQVLHSDSSREYYVKYIAERPRVELMGSHGLFGQDDAPLVLSKVQKEIAAHTGNIWTPIISLRREDAARLGYDSAKQWRNVLRVHAVDFAKAMKIPPENFRWYAAFHNEAHHPHIHMVCYSADPAQGYLSTKGIESMKSVLGRTIFRQDLISIYEQQDIRLKGLNEQARKTMQDLCQQISEGVCRSDVLEQLLPELADRLSKTGGRKVYGYLKPDVKSLVDAVVDELAKDERVVQCYAAWCEMRDAVCHTYTDHPPVPLPLSKEKAFKPVRNMVIAEAMKIGEPVPVRDVDLTFSQQMDVRKAVAEQESVHVVMEPDVLPAAEEIIQRGELHAKWTKRYKEARSHLFGSRDTEPDFEEAHALLLQEAENGNALAMHDLGRMEADGLGREVDAVAAHTWYQKAFSSFLELESALEPDDRGATYLQYRIGKMYMVGLGTEQNDTQAARWLTIAAEKKHKYAQYSLASLYYRGKGVEQDFSQALDLYAQSAVQGNAYASYEWGKMLRDGVGTPVDAAQAQKHFSTAYREFVAMELESGDDKLQYRIGQMLRDGVGVDADPQQARLYFERAARIGNPHAQYALAKLYLQGDGTPEQIAEALELLHKLGDSGNATAQYALGKLHRDGQHVECDVSRAILYFTQAAEQDNDFAAYALGRLYLDGDELVRDPDSALLWLKRSAEQNNQFAQYQLGKLCLTGEVIPKDISAALDWFVRSADQGNEFAQYQLGKLYLQGEEVQKDIGCAVDWLERSGTQGNQFAQYLLGKLYLLGRDIPRDREQALHWLTLSAEQGNEYAQFFIDHIDQFRDPSVFEASTRLLHQLGKIFEQQAQELGTKAIQIDRKRLRVLREKKIALGYAQDDQVQKQ